MFAGVHAIELDDEGTAVKALVSKEGETVRRSRV